MIILRCNIDGTTCTLCISGYFIYNNQCLSKCPTKMYGDTSDRLLTYKK